jgi:hypothetical protein
MKRNINKLTVFVVVAAMAVFMAVAMASAFDRDDHRRAIVGEYAFIGSGACLMAPGFTDDTHFIPTGDPKDSSIGPNTWEGVYTFNHDGTGEMDALNRFVDTMPSAGLAHIYWKFKYTVNKGKITFTYIPDTYVATYQYGPLAGFTLSGVTITEPWSGRISPDGENLFVSFGVPMKLIPPFPGLEIVCNGVHQGFRTDEHE